jgi:hypothetical protein
MRRSQFGNVEKPEDRYYFAHLYRSWHGSASKRDSEIPLIVANYHHRTPEIGAWVKQTIGARPYIQRLTDVILGLRAGQLGE